MARRRYTAKDAASPSDPAPRSCAWPASPLPALLHTCSPMPAGACGYPGSLTWPWFICTCDGKPSSGTDENTCSAQVLRWDYRLHVVPWQRLNLLINHLLFDDQGLMKWNTYCAFLDFNQPLCWHPRVCTTVFTISATMFTTMPVLPLGIFQEGATRNHCGNEACDHHEHEGNHPRGFASCVFVGDMPVVVVSDLATVPAGCQ